MSIQDSEIKVPEVTNFPLSSEQLPPEVTIVSTDDKRSVLLREHKQIAEYGDGIAGMYVSTVTAESSQLLWNIAHEMGMPIYNPRTKQIVSLKQPRPEWHSLYPGEIYNFDIDLPWRRTFWIDYENPGYREYLFSLYGQLAEEMRNKGLIYGAESRGVLRRITTGDQYNIAEFLKRQIEMYRDGKFFENLAVDRVFEISSIFSSDGLYKIYVMPVETISRYGETPVEFQVYMAKDGEEVDLESNVHKLHKLRMYFVEREGGNVGYIMACQNHAAYSGNLNLSGAQKKLNEISGSTAHSLSMKYSIIIGLLLMKSVGVSTVLIPGDVIGNYHSDIKEDYAIRRRYLDALNYAVKKLKGVSFDKEAIDWTMNFPEIFEDMTNITQRLFLIQAELASRKDPLLGFHQISLPEDGLDSDDEEISQLIRNIKYK